MTKNEIIDYALGLPVSAADCPFTEDFETTVLRHRDSRKWFGIILAVPQTFFGRAEQALNLKCPPELIPLLAEKYAGLIFPAYHMNRKHWITVRMRADDDIIKQLISLSYDITDNKRRHETE